MTRFKILSLLFISFTFTLNNCAKDSKSLLDTERQTSLSVIPADGSTGVQLNAPVTLSFAKSVVRSVVEENFHLISAKDMTDSMSPGHPPMHHSNMIMAMGDSAIMHHLDRFHSTSGSITWNSDSTFCSFMADSMLTPHSEYMICLGEGMVKMMEQRMGKMSMMNGMGTGMMNDNIMLHFTTID
jgi:hypothetical protein